MIKKIFAILLCLVMVVGCMAGCNKNEEQAPTAPTVNENPTEGTEEVAPPVEDVTEPAPETEPSEEVVDPTEEAPVEPMDVDVQITKVFAEAQAALGEEFRANMEIPAEMYEGMFGLDAATYTSIYGMMPMISAHVDTLVGVKAADVEAVSQVFYDYVEMKKADRMQYPTNAAAMGAMEVVVVGDYVWLVGTFGAADTVAEEGDEAILNYAKDNVAKVVEIINTICANEALV